jgi:hypothetical protein
VATPPEAAAGGSAIGGPTFQRALRRPAPLGVISVTVR